MDKNKNRWVIVAVIVAIIYGSINNENKIMIPLILMAIGIIMFVMIIIYKIYQNANLKKYGTEEVVKIENVIIEEENIDKYAKLLSNNTIDTCDVETLIKDFSIRITMKTKTEELVENVNALLDKIGYDVCISLEDIFKDDYDFIKVRRAKGYTTLRHDTNVIINILNNYNLEAINIEKDNNGDLNMAIISFDKLEELYEDIEDVQYIEGEYDEDIEE